jgi:hypothetical protein
VPFRGDETISNTFNFAPTVGETCDQTNVEPEAPSVVVNANETPDENTSEAIMNVKVINSRLIAIGKDYLAQRHAKYAPLSKTTKQVLNNKQWRRRRESKSKEIVFRNPVRLQSAVMSLEFSVPILAYPPNSHSAFTGSYQIRTTLKYARNAESEIPTFLKLLRSLFRMVAHLPPLT